MNILIVSQYFWPENFRINDLAAGLVERGHAVTVLTGIPNYPGGKFYEGYGLIKPVRQTYRSVNIVRVPLIPRGRSKGWQLVLNYLSFAAIAGIIGPFRLLRARFDIIFAFQTSPVTVAVPAIIMKRIKKAPILFWVLDLWPESLAAAGGIRSPAVLGAVRRFVRFVYRHCDAILTSSRSFIPSIESMGADPQKVRYFPNWAEEEYQTADCKKDARKSDTQLPSGFRIMFAGNIGEAQDFGTILDAAEKLRDQTAISWIILGDGRMSGWVKEQVAARGLLQNVHLLGRRSPEEMTSFFSQADVMLVTLKKDPLFALTVPGKIQSYMACGRPIIAALDGEGSRIIRESGAGIATPAGDADGLARSVMEMFRLSREERDRIGERGKQYCTQNFERDMLFKRLERWMQEMVPH